MLKNAVIIIARENYKDCKPMGMAASQAKLLTLTNRLHDVEYKAQHIESQKIALATQKDELYQNYCDALDATKIQVAFKYQNGTSKYMDATFASVCNYNENRQKQYTIRDANTGKVIVNEDVYDAYVTQGYDNDKYSFAWAMMGMADNSTWNDGDEDAVSIGVGRNQAESTGSTKNTDLWMSEAEQAAYDYLVKNNTLNSSVKKAYENLIEISQKSDAEKSDKEEALEGFRKQFYDYHSTEIYNFMRLNKNLSKDENSDPSASGAEFDHEFPDTVDKNQRNYYVRLLKQIEASGGCQKVDTQNVSGKDASQWFNQKVKSGQFLIDVYNESKKEWQETSVSTSTNENFLQEVNDETDLKKAEQEYEYELSKINTKDTNYDKDLSNLETERTSIKTEMESIQKVRDDNIERTFGIFS